VSSLGVIMSEWYYICQIQFKIHYLQRIPMQTEPTTLPHFISKTLRNNNLSIFEQSIILKFDGGKQDLQNPLLSS
jgi:hypothetical protein